MLLARYCEGSRLCCFEPRGPTHRKYKYSALCHLFTGVLLVFITYRHGCIPLFEICRRRAKSLTLNSILKRRHTAAHMDPLGAAIVTLSSCSAVLRAVPRGPYEPTAIGITDIGDDLTTDLNCELVCPLAIPAASLLVDTSVAGVVAQTAAGGRSIVLRLVLAEGCRESRQSPRELRLSVEAVCRHIVPTASRTDSVSGRVTELVCVAAPFYSDTGLLIAISAEIPASTAGSFVNVTSIVVGGQSLSGFNACRLPVCIALQCPWVHKTVDVIDYEVTPAVTASGCVMRSAVTSTACARRSDTLSLQVCLRPRNPSSANPGFRCYWRGYACCYITGVRKWFIQFFICDLYS